MDTADPAPQSVRDAVAACAAPGIGLMFLGGATALGGLAQAVAALFLQFVEGPPDDQLYLLLGYGLYSLAVGGFWVYAGWQLKRAKQYGLCVVACATALVPGLYLCCPLNLVFGLLGLRRLTDPRVKRGFEANRPGYADNGYN